MSKDKKDKDSSQDKINDLKAELTELKAQEEIKKLTTEKDSIKNNIQTEEKEIVQTFSNSVEIKKKRYIGLKNSILWVFLCNLLFFIVSAIMGHFYLKPFKFAEIIPEYGVVHNLFGALGFGFGSTLHPLGNMLLVSMIFRNNNLWRTLILLFLAAFWSVILIRNFLKLA
tara:strand:- start:236 stop:745 length:510 start_codon:yes stop_codon:yes gene_type:complete